MDTQRPYLCATNAVIDLLILKNPNSLMLDNDKLSEHLSHKSTHLMVMTALLILTPP